MSPSFIQLEHPSTSVTILRLCRPEVRNALSVEVRQALVDHLMALAADDEVRCVILAGGDKFFAAGADIKEMVDLGAIDMLRRAVHRLWDSIAAFPKPVIAAVRGYALGGGCELAMHADVIVAGKGAKFGQPEVKLGILPGGGGTQRFVRAAGKFRAMRYLLTGDLIDASTALSMGLVSEVVPDAEVEAQSIELAEKIASLPPLAITQIKDVVLTGMDLPLQSALAVERKSLQLLFATDDKSEGMRAFLEKRTPEFEGK